MASYQPVTQEFLAQLESIAPGRVTAGSEVNPDYGRDEMPIYGVHPPEAAVEILSTEEAAAAVKLCYAHNIPVTTRAGGRLRPCFWRRGPQHRPHEPDSGI
mgnify:CR=1 FL=1